MNWLLFRLIVKGSEGMPAVCNKCRRVRPQSGDTWCLGCGAWEVIGQELTSVWEGPPGLREVANDLVLGTARSIRALRNLGAGVSRAQGSRTVPEPTFPPRAQPVVAPPVATPPVAPPTTASKSAPARPDSSEYYYTEEEYSPEREDSPVRPPGQHDLRPTLPRRAKPGSGGEGGSGQSGVGLSRVVKEENPERSRERKEKEAELKRPREEEDKREEKRDKKREKKDKGESKEKKKKRKHRRGGRKHKRLGRLAAHPYQEVHRRLSSTVLDERPKL